jgi:hypothetical protein
VSDRPPSFIDEAISAARGVAGLVVGNREVERRFDLTLRGLLGSLIALLFVTAISAALPMLMGQPGGVLRGILSYSLLLSLQVGCSAIVLVQLKRLDGFVPYFTADNWASVYVTILSTGLNLAGVSDEFLSLPVAVLVIVIAVNIGRLIVKLEPLQVAMFVIAQMVGAVAGGFVLSLFVPISS